MITCSIAGHYDLTTPGFHMYSATKHAVTALTEGLRFELVSQGSKIRVTVSKTTPSSFVINTVQPSDVTVKILPPQRDYFFHMILALKYDYFPEDH
jgi:NADP-dependent 3-hydroxy acid dehydrogenase YdfG